MTEATPSVLIEAPRERSVAMDTNKVVLRPKKIRGGRDRGNQNGISRPKSEFFSPCEFVMHDRGFDGREICMDWSMCGYIYSMYSRL